MSRAARRFLADLGAALELDVRAVEFTGAGVLAGPYPMTDLAGGAWAGTGAPYRWSLSILDHSAGYLMAAAA